MLISGSFGLGNYVHTRPKWRSDWQGSVPSLLVTALRPSTWRSVVCSSHVLGTSIDIDIEIDIEIEIEIEIGIEMVSKEKVKFPA